MKCHVFSFSKQFRLRKPEEYKKVFAKPIKSTDQYFTLLASKNDLGFPRLGMAVAKKTVRNATKRNVLKRIIRENFRTKKEFIGNIDIVVLARKEATEAIPELLVKSLDKHWNKLASRCASCL